jgi:hypothetical protein
MVFQQVVELASDQPEMKTVHDITAHWNVSSIRNPDTSRIPVGGAKKKNPGQ